MSQEPLNGYRKSGIGLVALFCSVSNVRRNSHRRRGDRKMALTRKFLTALGIDEDKADEIIKVHTETTDRINGELEEAKKDAEKLTKVQKELDKLKEEASKDEGKNPWKVKYEAIKEEFDNYKADVDAKATKAKKEEAYKALLKECGVADKRIPAVTKVADIDKIELDEDGKIKDADALKESIKEEWSDFIQTDGVKGADTSTPPANEGGKMTKDEILAIKDTTERQKAMAENHELFGV